jgi:flavodoxin/ferredoxin
VDVTLICFSQTGNTRKVATAMAETFREAGHSARTISLREATPEDATKGDLLGVGTPCFSSQAPTPIKEFLRALPPLNDQRAFIFATSGGAPGRVLYDLTSLLRGKGADVLGGFLARGQVHHPAPHMTDQSPGHPDAKDLTHARRFAVAVAEHVSAGRSGPLPESRPDALKPRWDFYEFSGLISSDKMLRLVMPEPRLDPVKCDQCRWCVCECPMGNITLRQAQGRPLRPLDPSTSPSTSSGQGSGQSGLGTTQAQGRPLRQPFDKVYPERSRGTQDRAQGWPLRPLDLSTSPSTSSGQGSGQSGLGTTRAQGRLLQSYPVLGDQCIRCYRCLTGCPQKAFDANWRLADPFLLFLYNATFMRWFGNLEPGEKI